MLSREPADGAAPEFHERAPERSTQRLPPIQGAGSPKAAQQPGRAATGPAMRRVGGDDSVSEYQAFCKKLGAPPRPEIKIGPRDYRTLVNKKANILLEADPEAVVTEAKYAQWQLKVEGKAGELRRPGRAGSDRSEPEHRRRGIAAAARIVRGDESRRGRGRDADIPSLDRSDAAAATRIVRGDDSRRRGRDVNIPWRRVAAPPRPRRE